MAYAVNSARGPIHAIFSREQALEIKRHFKGREDLTLVKLEFDFNFRDDTSESDLQVFNDGRDSVECMLEHMRKTNEFLTKKWGYHALLHELGKLIEETEALKEEQEATA